MKSFVVQYMLYKEIAVQGEKCSKVKCKRELTKKRKRQREMGKMGKVTSDGKVIWGKSIF